MRYHVLFLLLAFFIPSFLFAEIAVKSFRILESDLTARVDAPLLDQNGALCAIIKVVTTQIGFTFDCGQIGIMKTVNKPSEIWVYLPYGAKRITISHPQLGLLRDYMFTQPIEKGTVYELVLVTGRVETTVVEEITSQWLLIRTQPDNALIYIDDLFVKSGEYQAKLKPGSYTYRVEAPLYHSEAGKVEVSDAKKELNVVLKPAFGYIDLTSSPESGASVIIDEKKQSKVTPFVSEPLASGEHTVQAVKDMFQPVVRKITVLDGQTTPVNFTLTPNFAEVSVTAPADAILYVNNQQKGTGTWQGRLNAGVYSLEARKDKHRPAKQDIEVAAGDKRVVNLQPTPIYGSLDVMTTPSGASIYINKKEYGSSPNTVNKLLIGDYAVQLSKPGYATVNKTVSVTEGRSIELNEILASGKVVTISSTPIGATLFIDGATSGVTPYSGNLTFGSHLLKIEKDGKKAEKTVTITQSGEETTFTLSFGITATDNLADDGNYSQSLEQYNKMISTNTAKPETYIELATLYTKIKNYAKSAETTQKYIDKIGGIDVAEGTDYYNLGRSLYNAGQVLLNESSPTSKALAKDYLTRADNAFGVVSIKSPESYISYLWRGHANASLDPNTTLGLAKPYYEKALAIILKKVENGASISSYRKDLLNIYRYEAWYYFDIIKDKNCTILYCNKMLELDPTNNDAKSLIDSYNSPAR